MHSLLGQRGERRGSLWILETGRRNKHYKPRELKLPESRDIEAVNRPSLGRKDAELPTEKDQLSYLEESLPVSPETPGVAAVVTFSLRWGGLCRDPQAPGNYPSLIFI